MRMLILRCAAALAIALGLWPCLLACSICGSFARRESLAREIEQSPVVLYGFLANPRLDPGSVVGSTEFHVLGTLESAGPAPSEKVLTIPQYLPVLNPKEPPHCIMMFRRQAGELRHTGGHQIRGTAIFDYLRGLLALEPGRKRLAYAGTHLGHEDELVASEAFLEFARAADADVVAAAKQLSAPTLRKLIARADLEPEKLSLYGYMLGACGGKEDAATLRGLLQRDEDRIAKAYEGLLAGYIALAPVEGWNQLFSLLSSEKQAFIYRYAAVRTLRFFQNARPNDVKAQVQHGLALMIPIADVADMAINDLRQRQDWSQTDLVLAQWNRRSHEAPIVRNALLRYALACPQPQAQALVERVRQSDPRWVRDLEEDLALEAEVSKN